MSGQIFNIQKFSIHDGPGIRTVIFFQGCMLRCKWCANPESQPFTPIVLFDKTVCTSCHTCLACCPKHAITLDNNFPIIDHSLCKQCKQCVIHCPTRALSMDAKKYSVKEVMDIIMQDYDFYEESNGGITLSGGEVLGQLDFALAIIAACKEKHIHIAIETTGYTTKENFIRCIQDIDLLLFDLKHYDRKQHYLGTNVYNDSIIENMKYAVSTHKEVIARIPVIPNYNNSIEDAYGFCSLLKKLGITTVHLLPFHQFGAKKYQMLNLPYTMEKMPQLHQEDLQEYQEIFIKEGFTCYF